MKWFANRCRGWRQSVSLLAAGALSPEEKAAAENHLAACPACQEFFQDLKQVVAPLASWEERYSEVEPDLAMQSRWARAIHRAAAGESEAPGTTRLSWRLLWSELVFPARRIWAGLAASWLVLILFNQSHGDTPRTTTASGALPAVQVQMAFRDQHRVLEEILGLTPTAPTAIGPQRPPAPKPRSAIQGRAVG